MRSSLVVVGACALALAGCASGTQRQTRTASRASEARELEATLKRADRLASEVSGGQEVVEVLPRAQLEDQLHRDMARYETLQQSLKAAFSGRIVAVKH